MGKTKHKTDKVRNANFFIREPSFNHAKRVKMGGEMTHACCDRTSCLHIVSYR